MWNFFAHIGSDIGIFGVTLRPGQRPESNKSDKVGIKPLLDFVITNVFSWIFEEWWLVSQCMFL